MPQNENKRLILGLTGRQHLILACIFLAALGLRFLNWSGQERNNPFFHAPVMDEEKHHDWAQKIASGEGLDDRPYFRSPLYYYLLAALYFFFGPNIALARMAGCVMGAATCYLIAQVGALMGGFRLALVAGLVAAVYWPFIYFDEKLLTVGAEVFLNVLMLWLLLLAPRSKSLRLFFMAGMVFGLAALARPVMLAVAPGLLVWFWMERAQLAATPSKKTAAVILFFVGAVLSILPVTIRNYAKSGEFVLIASNGGVNFYIGNNPQSDGLAAVVPGTRPDWEGGYEDTHRIPQEELGRQLTEGEVSSYWYGKSLDWIFSDPIAWIKLTFYKLRLFWSPLELLNNQPIYHFADMSEVSAIYWIGFPVVACLGIAALALLGGRWRAWLLILLYGLFYMAAVVLFFCPGRYRIPVIPVLILLASMGLLRLPELLGSRKLMHAGGYLLLACLCGLFIGTNPPDREFHRNQAEGVALYNLGCHYSKLVPKQPELRDKAKKYLMDALELRPGDENMRAAVIDTLLFIGCLDEAEEMLARNVADKPYSVPDRAKYAECLVYRGKAEQAVEQFKKIIELTPTQPEPYIHLGSLLVKMQRADEARAYLDKALSMQPGSGEALNQMGLVYVIKNQPDKAVEAFEKALAADPRNRQARLNLADVLGRLGQTDAAASHFKKLLEIDPSDAQAASMMANLLRRSGKTKDALAVLSDMRRRFPDNALILNDLAWILAVSKDKTHRNGAQAVMYAERAMQLVNPPPVMLLNTLAAAYAEAGQFERAIVTAQKALAVARSLNRLSEAGQIEMRLKLFQQGRAFHEDY